MEEKGAIFSRTSYYFVRINLLESSLGEENSGVFTKKDETRRPLAS